MPALLKYGWAYKVSLQSHELPDANQKSVRTSGAEIDFQHDGLQPESDMSSVATFTVRDLSRRTAEVLDAVRKFGMAEVRPRSGEVFILKLKKTPKIQHK